MSLKRENSALRSLQKSSFTIVNSGFCSFASLEFSPLSAIMDKEAIKNCNLWKTKIM